MNSPAYLAMLRQDRARAAAQRKRDAIREDLTDFALGALLALLVCLIAG